MGDFLSIQETLVILGILAVGVAIYKLWDPVGWKGLIAFYPHSGRFPDRRVRARRARLGDSVLARGLYLGASDRGLHVSSLDGKYRLLIPWGDVAVTWAYEPDVEEIPDDPALVLEVALALRSVAESISLPRSTANELAEAAGDRWPLRSPGIIRESSEDK